MNRVKFTGEPEMNKEAEELLKGFNPSEPLLKADLNGPQPHKMGEETFQGSPEKESVNVLKEVKRSTREKVKEIMGQAKENVVFEKSTEKCEMKPGMNYKKLKDEESK